MKKSISIALVLCVLLSLSIPAVSANGIISIVPYYTYISSMRAELVISALGIATCEGKISSYNASASTGKVVVTLQKKDGTWQDVKSWTTTGSALNTVGSDLYVVSRGYYYRVHVTGTIYNSSGTALETDTLTSKEVWY